MSTELQLVAESCKRVIARLRDIKFRVEADSIPASIVDGELLPPSIELIDGELLKPLFAALAKLEACLRGELLNELREATATREMPEFGRQSAMSWAELVFHVGVEVHRTLVDEIGLQGFMAKSKELTKIWPPVATAVKPLLENDLDRFFHEVGREYYRAIEVDRKMDRASSTSVSSQNDEPKIEPDSEQFLSGEEKALALLIRHPDWTDKTIAENVPCHRTTLYDWERYRQARKALKSGSTELPRGSKTANGDMEAQSD